MKSKVVGAEGHVTSFSKDSIVDDNMKFKPVLLAKSTPSLQDQQTQSLHMVHHIPHQYIYM